MASRCLTETSNKTSSTSKKRPLLSAHGRLDQTPSKPDQPEGETNLSIDQTMSTSTPKKQRWTGWPEPSRSTAPPLPRPMSYSAPPKKFTPAKMTKAAKSTRNISEMFKSESQKRSFGSSPDEPVDLTSTDSSQESGVTSSSPTPVMSGTQRQLAKGSQGRCPAFTSDKAKSPGIVVARAITSTVTQGSSQTSGIATSSPTPVPNALDHRPVKHQERMPPVFVSKQATIPEPIHAPPRPKPPKARPPFIHWNHYSTRTQPKSQPNQTLKSTQGRSKFKSKANPPTTSKSSPQSQPIPRAVVTRAKPTPNVPSKPAASQPPTTPTPSSQVDCQCGRTFTDPRGTITCTSPDCKSRTWHKSCGGDTTINLLKQHSPPIWHCPDCRPLREVTTRIIYKQRSRPHPRIRCVITEAVR